MAKTHKAIQEAINEGHRRHLARYYDPGQNPGVDSATIHKWQFEQAMTNLVAMLGSYNDIGVDWGMDDDAMCSSLPFPGVGTLCNQTAENAIRNYIGIVTTYDDAEELCAKVAQSQWIVQIRAVLARMTWYLYHEGPDSCAKKLAAEGHEKEAIAMLREMVSRACEDGLTELKRLLSEYDPCQHEQIQNKKPVPKQAIEIYLKDFYEGPSKILLEELVNYPSGVNYNIERHGKNQPKTLKERLKDNKSNDYKEAVKHIHREKDSIYIDNNLKIILKK